MKVMWNYRQSLGLFFIVMLMAIPIIANQFAQKVQAASIPYCDPIGQTDSIVLYRCYDDVEDRYIYINDIGFIAPVIDLGK